MNITTRTKEGVTVLDLDGKLVGGVPLQQTVQELLASGVTKILLNLDGVDWMDSSGLGELTATLKMAGQKGAALKLLQVQGKVKEVLVMTRLLWALEVYDEETEAVSSFR
jgi:anti-sigma B factor antagonist